MTDASARWLVSIGLGIVAGLGCATRPDPAPTVASGPVKEVVAELAEPIPPDLCASRSLDAAVEQARVALAAGARDSAEQRGLAIEQALACDARARRWQLELEAVSLLEHLDPLPEPQPQCRVSSDGWCGQRKPKKDEPRDPSYDPLAHARLDAYARYEADAAPGEALRSIRARHIRTKLNYRDFEGALPLLQNYVVDYPEHADAVRMAILLVDTLAMTWLERRDVPTYRGTSALAWFARLETLALWHDPTAVALHERIAELRPAAMWTAAIEALAEGRAEQAALVEAGLPPSYEFEGTRRCAELFLAIYEAYPDHDRPDTLLWIAAACYDRNYDREQSHAVRIMLLSRYPDSEHYQDTLRYLADDELAMARYDEAEDHYREFARRYPKAYDTRDALEVAWELGVALGHDTSKVVAEYVRREERRDMKRAGTFAWQTRPKDPQRLLDFSTEFLEHFGKKTGLPSRDAERVLAELHWAKTCRGQLDDGLCVERKTVEPSNPCSLGGVPLPDFRGRKGRQATRARARITSFFKASKGLTKHYDDRALDEQWAAKIEAASVFLRLEPELEDYLLAGPDAPDARERAKQLDQRYLEVAALGQPDLAIRAHARRGLIWELLASSGLRPHEGTCLPATAWAHGDRERALAAYTECLALATTHQHFNDSARRCESKLAGEDPQRVPPLLELFGEPGLLPTEPHTTGVVAPAPPARRHF